MSPIKRPRFGEVFLFCPFAIQPRTSVCSAFCVVHAINYTTSDAKSFTGLCRSFSGYLPHFAPVIRLCILLCCTSCKALEDIQASAAPPQIPRCHRHAGRCAGQDSRCVLLWIYARRCSTSQTMPARRLEIWHLISGAGGAEPLTAAAVSLFRAFAR